MRPAVHSRETPSILDALDALDAAARQPDAQRSLLDTQALRTSVDT